MKILVTGAAGFIGFHLTEALLKEGNYVIGLDNINDYYEPKLKFNRLKVLGISKNAILWNSLISSSIYPNLQFIRINLEDSDSLFSLFETEKFDVIFNLAAQAGVRYSLENPGTYIQSNIVGFFNILEASRKFSVKRLIYASSSSVYGLNKKVPFSEKDSVDCPISLYAASKKSNELMAYSYSHLFELPTIGLRFFTVYGPYGRPDMAYYSFTKSILEGTPIKVFNNGNLKRDFTYIDDVINGMIKILKNEPKVFDLASTEALKNHYTIYNIGNNEPIRLSRFVKAIESACKKKAIINYLASQPGDVERTYADTTKLYMNTGFKPSTKIEEGISRFVNWYLSQGND